MRADRRRTADRRARPGAGARTTLLLLTLGAALVAGAVEPARLVAGFPRARMIVEGDRHCIGLELHVATTATQRTQGLMYVEELGAFEGMYFAYPEPATIVMWMQNTYIPLDMLFVDADGRIAGIAAHTTPLSTERIRSPADVSAVLEVNGGFSARWQVRVGHRILSLDPEG